MTMEAVERLVAASAGPLGPGIDAGFAGHESLLPLLRARNGLVAFESALLVRPCGGGPGSIEWWNELDWKEPYRGVLSDALCFAEDAFGFQFMVNDSGFHSFDPETAEIEFVARTVDEWASRVLEDFEMLTGYPLLHEWQLAHGPLRPGYRLAPAVPFVLGGEYSVEALRAKPDVELADFRAGIYTQIRDLPEGAQVKLSVE